MKILKQTIVPAAACLLTLQVVSAQNVGLNTQTPVGTLDIRSTGQTASSHALLVSNAASDTMMVIRDDGRVGIGTTQPAYALDVQSADPVAARFNAPVEGQPAVNQNELTTLGQVQNLIVSASGSASPTMFSAASTTDMYFTSALIYCRNLTEGGYTDWRVPTLQDWIELVQNDAVVLPTYISNRYYWISPGDGAYPVYSYYWLTLYISTSNLSTNNSHYITNSNNSPSSSAYTFCVR